MTDEENLQKSLTNIKNGEKGWAKSLASANGSFSRKLAEENLRRLGEMRLTLLNGNVPPVVDDRSLAERLSDRGYE